MKRAAVVVGLMAMLTASLLASAQAAGISDAVRVLAENVLGQGLVTAVRVSAGGTDVTMRWESATYRPVNKVVHTRQMLYGEAQLATGAVMGRLPQIARVRFVITGRGQMLATGENRRGRGVTLTFAGLLGGGTHVPPETDGDPARIGGGEAAKEF